MIVYWWNPYPYFSCLTLPSFTQPFDLMSAWWHLWQSVRAPPAWSSQTHLHSVFLSPLSNSSGFQLPTISRTYNLKSSTLRSLTLKLNRGRVVWKAGYLEGLFDVLRRWWARKTLRVHVNILFASSCLGPYIHLVRPALNSNEWKTVPIILILNYQLNYKSHLLLENVDDFHGLIVVSAYFLSLWHGLSEELLMIMAYHLGLKNVFGQLRDVIV